MASVADLLPLSPDGSRVLIVTHYLPFHATLAPAHHAVNQSPHTTPRHHHHHRPSIPSARRSIPDFRPYMNGSIPPTPSSPLAISGGGGGGGGTSTSAESNSSPTAKDRTNSSSNGGSPSRSNNHKNPATTSASLSNASTAPSSPSRTGKYSNLKWHFTARGDHSALNAVRILSSAEQTNNCIFIGLLDHFYTEDGQSVDANSLTDEQKQELTKALLLEKRCVPVFIDPAVSSGHYEGFCKQGNPPVDGKG